MPGPSRQPQSLVAHGSKHSAKEKNILEGSWDWLLKCFLIGRILYLSCVHHIQSL